jgi:hypothetical protein
MLLVDQLHFTELWPEQPVSWGRSNQTFRLLTVVILITGNAHFDAMP